MIHMSEWYIFSEKGSYLRQRALYSDDRNRLQQTATDCNIKKAHLCVKKPCIPMTATDCNRTTATDFNRLQQKEGSSLRQRALYSDDCNRLQQTATDCNRLQQKEGSSLRQSAMSSEICSSIFHADSSRSGWQR